MIDAEKKVCAICQVNCTHEWDEGVITLLPTAECERRWQDQCARCAIADAFHRWPGLTA